MSESSENENDVDINFNDSKNFEYTLYLKNNGHKKVIKDSGKLFFNFLERDPNFYENLSNNCIYEDKVEQGKYLY